MIPIVLTTFEPIEKRLPTGPAAKPETCRNCRLFTRTTGVTLDLVTPKTKVLLVFLHPTNDETNARTPLAGRMGAFTRRLANAAGFEDDEIGVSYVFRCFADYRLRDKDGKLKQEVVDDGLAGCRVYDSSSVNPEAGEVALTTGMREWGADVWMGTFEPNKGFLEPAFALLTREDLKKAKLLAGEGMRPAVIFGSQAMKAIMPWTTDGGMRMWRGSAEAFTWAPAVDRKEKVAGVFKPLRGGWRRRRS